LGGVTQLEVGFLLAQISLVPRTLPAPPHGGYREAERDDDRDEEPRGFRASEERGEHRPAGDRGDTRPDDLVGNAIHVSTVADNGARAQVGSWALAVESLT
jgi:hypothetical protein